jgi:glycosyltransferase involved in cell wall biosynthesis
MTMAQPKTPTSVVMSVVVPVFNESENVFHTAQAFREAFGPAGVSYELIFVNDGSTDDTAERIAELARTDPAVRLEGYPVNTGRGKALRTGLAAARGQFVATIDADLSYRPSAILDMMRALEQHPGDDFAVGSPYAKDGGVEGVPVMRLLISRLGNAVLRRFMPGDFHTFTGILRCYRRGMVDRLVLESNGKEVHLEILTKALVLGFQGLEVPAVLRGRRRGRSKFRFRQTAVKHLIYGLHEKPMGVFGLVGLAMLLIAVGLGIYLLVLSAMGIRVGGRPLLAFVAFLGIAAMLILGLGFVSLQNVVLRNELFKIASQNKAIADRLDRIEGGKGDPR